MNACAPQWLPLPVGSCWEWDFPQCSGTNKISQFTAVWSDWFEVLRCESNSSPRLIKNVVESSLVKPKEINYGNSAML